MRVDSKESGGSNAGVDGVGHKALAEAGDDERNDILVRAEDPMLA